MDRRAFLHLSAGAALSSGAIGRMAVWGSEPGSANEVFEASRPARTFSVIPVVGDGKWIWNKPPEGQTGYLEPRPFESTIGIELQGQGGATQIKASTPVLTAQTVRDRVRNTNPKRQRGQMSVAASLTLRVSVGPRIIRLTACRDDLRRFSTGSGSSPSSRRSECRPGR
jgi:hypothetical protein